MFSSQGDLKEWKALTHNARIENLNESKLYSASLSEGKRCVVVMEGFYEYKKTGSQPAEVYYLHSPQDNLLKAAGLFATMKRENVSFLLSEHLIIARKNKLFLKLLYLYFLGRHIVQLYRYDY